MSNLMADQSGKRIVIPSTHIVSDVKATVTSIAIINQGQRIIHAAPETILMAVEEKAWMWIVSSGEYAKPEPQVKANRWQDSGITRVSTSQANASELSFPRSLPG